MRVVTDSAAVAALAASPEVAATSMRLARVGQAGAQRRAPYRTGLLRVTIEVVSLPAGGARWGTDIDYGAHQEFGTFKMPAHPFVRPSVDDLRGAL